MFSVIPPGQADRVPSPSGEAPKNPGDLIATMDFARILQLVKTQKPDEPKPAAVPEPQPAKPEQKYVIKPDESRKVKTPSPTPIEPDPPARAGLDTDLDFDDDLLPKIEFTESACKK